MFKNQKSLTSTHVKTIQCPLIPQLDSNTTHTKNVDTIAKHFETNYIIYSFSFNIILF